MLTRMIIGLRVPMAMMAALLVAVMVASIWLVATGMVLVASPNTLVGVEISLRGYVIAWGNLDPWFEDGIHLSILPEWIRWTWWPPLDRFGYSPSVDFIAFPQWAIVVPTVALAVAGFRARRAHLARGHCLHCDYLMSPSLTCPECGRPTSRRA